MTNQSVTATFPTENRQSSDTPDAILKRLNRRLAQDWLVCRKTRGSRWFNDLGEFYIVNERNHITHTHVDPVVMLAEIEAERSAA
jgi:hypothetical protein